jgi:hypothetical protein
MGKTFCEEVLQSSDVFSPPYSVTASRSGPVDLLVLQVPSPPHALFVPSLLSLLVDCTLHTPRVPSI